MKLVAVSLPALGPGDYSDENGLVLRVRTSGARSWAVRYSLGGRDVRFTIGKVKLKDGDKGLTLKQAKNRALEIQALVVAGRDPQAEKIASRRTPKTEALTVEQLVRKALKAIPLHPRTRHNYGLLATKYVFGKLGPIPCAELTRTMIRQWSDAIARKRPSMANHAFHIVARSFAYGLERDLVGASPFPGLKRPAVMSERERVLSPVELWALHRALDRKRSKRWPNPVGPAVVRLLLLTGARKMMVLGARREEFDLDAVGGAVWTIPAERMKAGREHVIPLVPAAVEIVRARLALTSGSALFPGGAFPAASGRARARAAERAVNWSPEFVASLRKKLDEELVAAGQKPAAPWVIHDIRRTIATHLREKGNVGLDVISLLLSHSPREGPRVTYTYMRAPLLKERRAALEWWDGGRAVAIDPRTNVVRMEAKHG